MPISGSARVEHFVAQQCVVRQNVSAVPREKPACAGYFLEKVGKCCCQRSSAVTVAAMLSAVATVATVATALGATALPTAILLLSAVVIAGISGIAVLRVAAGIGLSLLPVVLLPINLSAMTIFGHLNISLLAAADLPIGPGACLHLVGARLPLFQATCFAWRQLPGLDALFDALLLVDVALNVTLHALRGSRVRVAALGIVLFSIDVLTDLVLRLVGHPCRREPSGAGHTRWNLIAASCCGCAAFTTGAVKPALRDSLAHPAAMG